jgi:hypothetical protein
MNKNKTVEKMIEKGRIKCTFTSVWGDGSIITTPCTYNVKTGEVDADSVDEDPKGGLIREYITVYTDELGLGEEEIEVCPVCHSFVMTTVMKEGVGKQLDEVKVCSDPSCENHKE